MGNCMGETLRNNKAASKFPHFRRESYLSAARGQPGPYPSIEDVVDGNRRKSRNHPY